MQQVLDPPVLVEENELPPQIEIEEDMPKDHPTLTERVTRLEGLIGEIKTPSRPFRWKEFIIGILIPLAGVLVAYFAWWEPRNEKIADEHTAAIVDSRIDGKFAEHHVDDLVSSVNEIKGRLGEISELQKLIIGTLLKQNASLSSGEFRSNLSTVTKAFESATAHDVPIDPATISAIQTKLVAVKDHDPNYWKAASSLINYRFSVPPQIKKSILPNCFDQFKFYSEGTPHTQGHLWAHEQTFGNCELTIDDVRGYWASGFGKSVLEHGDPNGVVIKFHLHDGIVNYNGGELIPFRSLECLRCEFRVKAVQPPPAGQKFVQTLIAENRQNVVLSGNQPTQ